MSNILSFQSLRAWCAPNYYGKDCNTLCVSQDDNEKGHFTCDKDTGGKVCISGWTGPKCLTGKK